jgi:hypothetical protein
MSLLSLETLATELTLTSSFNRGQAGRIGDLRMKLLKFNDKFEPVNAHQDKTCENPWYVEAKKMSTLTSWRI